MKACRLHSFIKATLALVCAGFMANSASYAGPITPDYDTFGLLSAATFGGDGIPNDYVAITTTIDGVTLGLTATQRYSNPPVTNDGAGTFFATPGEDTLPNYARWNFSIYANNASTTNYLLQLLWDMNPGAGTDEAFLATFGSGSLAAGSTFQDSWNLGMPFLGGSFDPTVAGEYSFALILWENNNGTPGQELGRSAINVNVGHVPDTASTGLLTLAGLGSLLVMARMRRQTK